MGNWSARNLAAKHLRHLAAGIDTTTQMKNELGVYIEEGEGSVRIVKSIHTNLKQCEDMYPKGNR